MSIGDKLYKIEKKIKKCCCNDSTPLTGCCYEEVTRAEALGLMNSNLLIPNTMYKITDRGDNGIFLVAISNNKFDEEGVRLMLIPTPSFPVGLGGQWNHLIDNYDIGSYVYWMGYFYQSLTGNNGDAPNNDPVNWLRIEKSTEALLYEGEEFEIAAYIEAAFGVIYDIVDDWISRQWDTYGNVFGTSHIDKYSDSNGYFNPVDVSDWVLVYLRTNSVGGVIMQNNVCEGIWGNLLYSSWDGEELGIYDNFVRDGAIAYNRGYKYIRHNEVFGEDGITYNSNSNIEYISGETTIPRDTDWNPIYIENNIVQGSIYSNVGHHPQTYPMYISNNLVRGDIASNAIESYVISYIQHNSCSSISSNFIFSTDEIYGADISSNTIPGEISGNGFNADNIVQSIVLNTNGGGITSNYFNDEYSIRYNKNNGSISNNTNQGDITYNANLGNILGNTNSGNIVSNANNGDISDNANLGNITQNLNNGYIAFCTSTPNACSIYNNINNGYISGVYAADVNDTVVNK